MIQAFLIRWFLLSPFRTGALFALIFAAIMLARGYADVGRIFPDTDDAMRLVQVRQWLEGGGWYDLRVPRLDPPNERFMHWSRLVDVPIAALIQVGRLWTDMPGAERFAMAAEPLLLLVILVIIVTVLAFRIGGRYAILPAALSIWFTATKFQFIPGRIDHHNIQVVVISAMLLSAINRRGAFMPGAWTGAFLALAVAIGGETFPYTGLTLIFVCCLWIIRGSGFNRAAREFGLALAGAVAILYLGTIAPTRWLESGCDALAFNLAAALVLSGLGLALLTAVQPLQGSLPIRFSGVAVVGGLSIALILALDPSCAGGPYAHIDQEIWDNWLSHVEEVLPLPQFWRQDPRQALFFIWVPLIAIPAGLFLIAAETRPRASAVLLLLLAGTALGLTFMQNRTATYADVFGMILFAGGVGSAVRRYRPGLLSRPSLLLGLTLLLAGAGLMPVTAPSAAGARITAVQPPGSAPKHFSADICYRPDTYLRLAALPIGLVASHVDFGTTILASTPHSVLGAPYHRMMRGIRDTVRIWSADKADVAKAIIDARKVDYLVGCKGVRAQFGYGPFAAVLRSDHVPDWLERVGGNAPDDPIIIYRVRR
jgi:hypothetical protein